MVFLLIIISVITARNMNNFEAVRRNLETVLRENSERLEIALEAADLGTWSFDIKTGVAAHSLRHDQIFGYKELQPEWSYEISIKHMLPEFHPIAREAVAKAIKTGKLYFQAKVLWPDGSIHWIEPTGRVHYNENGEPVSMTGVVADITEAKQSTEKL
jgi:PAS domain S-box-containing protein